MAARKKPPAELRTVDIFSGKTRLEEDEIRKAVALEELQEHKKERVPITIQVLDKALLGYKSPGFEELDGIRCVQVSEGMFYLERVRDNGTSYSGMYIKREDLEGLVEWVSVFLTQRKN